MENFEQLNTSEVTPESPITQEEVKESPIQELLTNNPELAKIYNESRSRIQIKTNESGQIVSGAEIYDDSPKMHALVELSEAIESSIPSVQEGYIRLWRGNRPDEVGHNPSYTNSLAGIALPFLRGYQGVLSYIDVNQDDAKKYVLAAGSAKDSEFVLPTELVKNVSIVGHTLEKAEEIKGKAKPLPETSSTNSEGDGWASI